MPARLKKQGNTKTLFSFWIRSASLEETEPDNSNLLQGENVAIAEDRANSNTESRDTESLALGPDVFPFLFLICIMYCACKNLFVHVSFYNYP